MPPVSRLSVNVKDENKEGSLKHTRVETAATLWAEHFQSHRDFLRTAVLEYSFSLHAVHRNNSWLQAYYPVMSSISL